MLVVNFFAGPGAGKSTCAAGTFHALKRKGVNAELVTEYAKELAWEKRGDALSNQVRVLGEQFERMRRLEGSVDILVTDSPLLLSAIYTPADYPREFERVVRFLFDRYENLNIFVERTKPYNPAGRFQDEEGAREIDRKIKGYLFKSGVPSLAVPDHADLPGYAADLAVAMMR